MYVIEGKYASANVFMQEPLENSAFKQVLEIINSPCSENSKIAIMPDCHTGTGCCIGFTQRYNNKIVPNFVGVDIACGMLVTKIDRKESRKINLEHLDKIINQNIPSGESRRNKIHEYAEHIDYSQLTTPINKTKVMQAVGTLGEGNHFIELDKDDEENFYLVIHSGSRHLGAAVWEYWQKIAASNRPQGVPEHLAWLENDELTGYIQDTRVCTQYSNVNRQAMRDTILEKLGIKKKNTEEFTTLHNYIDVYSVNGYSGMIRKGAVHALGEENIIIPINMRDGALIVKGGDNIDANYSCPHGSGRLMSRADAKSTLSMKDFKEEMKGIYTSCIKPTTIDEAPRAYKSMDFIINNLEGLCTVKKIIKPIYNFKSSAER